MERNRQACLPEDLPHSQLEYVPAFRPEGDPSMHRAAKWIQRFAFVALAGCLLQGTPRAAEPDATTREANAVATDIDREIDKLLAEQKVPASAIADDAE